MTVGVISSYRTFLLFDTCFVFNQEQELTLNSLSPSIKIFIWLFLLYVDTKISYI